MAGILTERAKMRRQLIFQRSDVATGQIGRRSIVHMCVKVVTCIKHN